MISRVLGVVLVAGFLADLLASTDPDVEAGIDAYEAGDHDAALAAFDAAIERLGDRPELAFDRGLALLGKGDTEGARAAFQRATEADTSDVRASALYELGNLELDAEAWDAAIERYTECLKANPEHFSAKWNLELAQKRKEEKEEEDESSSSEDSGGSEESGGSETGGSEGDSGEDTGGEESGKQEETGKDD